MGNKKLLFITTRLFWPTDSGRKVSLYYYCKGLHEEFGYDIYLYSFLEEGQTEQLAEGKPDFIEEIRFATPVSGGEKVKNLLLKSVCKGWPFQNAIYFSQKNATAIEEYVNTLCPDVVFVDMIRLAPYYCALKNFTGKKILDLDDLLSKRYQLQTSLKSQKGNLFGAFTKKKKSLAQKIADIGWLKRLVLKSESKRVKKAEIYYGKKYDGVIFVSERETALYNEWLGEKKAVTVRLGVDHDYFSQTVAPKKEGALGFLGNLKYEPNVASLDFIVRKILPKLNFDYTLYVVGNVPQEVADKYYAKNIIFCGRVEDVRTVLQPCEAFVAPIAYGTGIKTKNLEAMSMGLPVVTNTLGVEGVDVTEGENIIVAEEPQELAKQINLLHFDQKYSSSIGRKAQELISRKYRWSIIYQSFKELHL